MRVTVNYCVLWFYERGGGSSYGTPCITLIRYKKLSSLNSDLPFQFQRQCKKICWSLHGRTTTVVCDRALRLSSLDVKKTSF